MTDKHITIVVRGPDGSGRTQFVEKIKHLLLNEGFEQVSVNCADKIDLFEGQNPRITLPIYITEG